MLPIFKLDDKTFSELVEEARKVIPRYTKEWTDHNLHDPGITFIELFSWLGEIQHYYLDRIRKENFLKFLKLLGIKPRDAKSATADVTFSLNTPKWEGFCIPEGTKLSTGEIVFETEEDILIVSVQLKKIITSLRSRVLDHTAANGTEGQHFYAFGEEAKAKSRLYLGFTHPFPKDKSIPITFNLYEKYPMAKGMHGDEKPNVVPSACLAWEYWSSTLEGRWNPLTIIKDETLMLSQSGRITFWAPSDMKEGKVPATDSECYWIRATVMQAGYELAPRIESILLNTISVKQRDTTRWKEEIGSSSGLPGQSFLLKKFPIVPESLVLQVGDRYGETLEWKDWIRVNDFDASKPSDRHYVLTAETGQIFFGDGVNGAIPPVASENENNIRAITYQTTVGEKGNVEAKVISLINDPIVNVGEVSVQNKKPASGGAPKETLDEAKARARRELRTGHSAVTLEDFENLAVSTPGLRVARAKAIPLIGPPDFTTISDNQASVTIVVVPYSEAEKPIPSKGFLKTVECHLNEHRLITTQLHVIAPEYVQVRIEALVSIKPDSNSLETCNRIDAALKNFLHPLRGGHEGKGWPIGRTIYKSEIYELIGKIEEVDHVQEVKLIGEGNGLKISEGNLHIQPIGLVFSGEHKIEIDH